MNENEMPPEFPLPWRVDIPPGTKFNEAGVPEIIHVLDADGGCVAVIARHPVWKHREMARMRVAVAIADAANAKYQRDG